MGVVEGRGAYSSWLRRQELEKAPFTFEIRPNLQVGYRDQILRLLKNIDQKQKLVLITGPTGSGKTTLLNYIGSSEKDIVFMNKPPRKTEDLLKIPNHFSPEIPVLTRIFTKKPGDVQEIPQYLNKVLSGHKVLFVDEAHEASIEVLEWFRVIADQVPNLTIVFSALPVFEETLTKNLETLKKRISEKIELNALSRDETEELIRRRIENAGGKGIKPFTYAAIDHIYQRTGGFPRDVLALCNHLFNIAAEKDAERIDTDLFEVGALPERKPVDLDRLNTLPEKQKMIIGMFLEREPLSPTDISLQMQDYPSKKHALRAVNNILKRMVDEGYIERKKDGKSFSYVLSPATRTKMVRA